jgi:hypothetical protein
VRDAARLETIVLGLLAFGEFCDALIANARKCPLANAQSKVPLPGAQKQPLGGLRLESPFACLSSPERYDDDLLVAFDP